MKSIGGWIALGMLAGSWAVSGADAARTLPSPKALAESQAAPARMKPAHPRPPWHTITMEPRPNLPEFHWYTKINPVWWLKNDDQPVPPDWYRPEEKHRVLKWHLRNPFHNFTYYVIGTCDKRTFRSGRYPEANTNPHGGWNFAVSRRGWFPRPFVDYRRGSFEFYFGWQRRGNFGIKLNLNQAPPRKQTPPPQPVPVS
jgi:hypothetical protein